MGMVRLSVSCPVYDAFGRQTGIAQCQVHNHAVTVLRFAATGSFTAIGMIYP
jgi:hypothetical protein